MTTEMTVVGRLKAGMRFDVETGSGHHVPLDAAEHNGGQNSAPQPMEMLLVGLAGCAAEVTWSPDGRQIAFGAGGGIYVVNSRGGGKPRLIHTKRGLGYVIRPAD